MTSDAADAILGNPTGSTIIQIGGQLTSDGSAGIATLDDNGSLYVGLNTANLTATGALTANQSSTQLSLLGQASATLSISGSWTGTIQIRGSNDGNTIIANLILVNVNTGIASTAITANGTYQANTAGYNIIYAHATSVTGSATYTLTASPGESVLNVGNLPPGAATSANQTSQLTQETAIAVSTANIDTKMPSVGQKAMAASTPVAIASDQSAIPVSVASVPLPTGASTAALQSNVQSAPGTPQTVALTIQGNSGGLAVPVSTAGQTIGVTQNTVPWASNISQFGGNNAVTGTGVGGLGIPRVTVSSDSFPATQPISGSVTIANPLGQAAAASAVAVALSNEDVQDLYVTGQSAQTATVNNILTVAAGSAATDLTGYRSFSVQVVSTGTGGTFIFEGSNDNVSFITVPVFNQLILTGTPITAAVTATASQIIYQGSSHFRYLRLRIATTITGGSIQAFSKFSQPGFAPGVLQVSQATGANLNVSAAIASGTVTTVSSVTSSNTGIPGTISDVASAAIITTTTTATLTPTFGSSYLVDIPVTAVSGTSPTMVVQVQESPDSGTNWFTVYTFPLINATGSYTSPVITLQGNRIRYVQTIGGTTPSFTRAINRLQSSQAGYTIASGGNLTDASGITSGTPSTSTTALAANSFRRYLLIENVSANNLWVNFTSAATATQPSFVLIPNGSLVMEGTFVSGEAVNVLSAVASQAYTLKWA